MTPIGEGGLQKLGTGLLEDGSVQYQLRLSTQSFPLNGLLGAQIRLSFAGQIFCENCGKRTKTSFSQGYCFNCFKKLAACDTCIMSPEKCHYAQGTCREPRWGEQFCFQPHIVYLANSAGLKVGITRETQLPTRWIDQGATAALPLYRVNSRYLSGCIEVICKQFVSDRTPWQSMLKGFSPELNLLEQAQGLTEKVQQQVDLLIDSGSTIAPVIEKLSAKVVNLNYPVSTWPTKVVSLSFDKTPVIEGRLLGIKGQYLILDSGCLNIRKFTSYQVSVSTDSVA